MTRDCSPSIPIPWSSTWLSRPASNSWWYDDGSRRTSPSSTGRERSTNVPITAIISLIAVVGSFVYGYDTIVMAVERSASEETVVVDGVEVNHQYSKSLEFELLTRDLIAGRIDPGLVYGSALRPYSELAIAHAFARMTEYHATFCSCNTVDRQRDAAGDGWCGECPKCRFVGLMLAPFVEPEALPAIIGRDMFADPGQVPGFAALMSRDGKPFECVGERLESAAALRLLSGLPRWRDQAVVQALPAPPTRCLGHRRGHPSAGPARTGLPRARHRRRGGPGAGGGGREFRGAVCLEGGVVGDGERRAGHGRTAGRAGVVPLLVDDRAGQVGVRTGSAPGRTVVRPDQVVWRDVDVVVRAPG